MNYRINHRVLGLEAVTVATDADLEETIKIAEAWIRGNPDEASKGVAVEQRRGDDWVEVWRHPSGDVL